MKHLDQHQLLRALDDELTDYEAEPVETHLALCEECRANYCQLGAVSVRVEQYVGSIVVPMASPEQRRLLADRMEHSRQSGARSKKTSAMRWAGMAVAVAAGLAAVLVIPARHAATPVESGIQTTIQVGGEQFVRLPYSNSELPTNTSHIVQMEVPVASLADAGIVVEPVSNEVLNPNRSVETDVLLGQDGEPLGIHVPDAN